MRRPFLSAQFDSRWIPASPRIPAARQKLMIVLHGRGDSVESFADIRNEMVIPEMNYLLLNAPRSYDGGFSWYSLEPRHEAGIRAARKQLAQLIADLRVEGWKQEDIFFLGHSQGALMVCDLLMTHSGRFGGAVGISGYVWFFRGWRASARRSAAWVTPWLMTYGLRDRLIRPSEIREDLEILWQNGAPVAAREFNKGHDFDFAEEVPFVREWLRFQFGSVHAPTRAAAKAAAPERLGLPLVLKARRRSLRARV